MRFGDTSDDFESLLDGRTVVDADEDFLPDMLIGEGPVDHCALEDDAIRNEDFDAIGAAELRATGADRRHCARISSHIDDVADTDRTFKEENDAADQIVDELLGSKSHSDRCCPAKECKNRERDLHHR